MDDKRDVILFGKEAKQEAIKQAYKCYLDNKYAVEYYQHMHSIVFQKTRKYEFTISLGTLISGGSGLGILASEWMAVPCGLVTAGAIVLTAAKQSWNWQEQIEYFLKMIDGNGTSSGAVRRLIDDCWIIRDWTPQMTMSLREIQKQIDLLPKDKFEKLSENLRNKIQDDIEMAEKPASWWKGPEE